MNPKRLFIAFLLLLAVIGGFVWRAGATRRLLMNSDELVLYSLEPGVVASHLDVGDAYFHYRVILGKVSLSNQHEKAAVLSALFNTQPSFSEKVSPNFYQHAPIFGIRAIRGNQFIDVTFGAQASGVVFYSRNKVVKSWPVNWETFKKAQAVFNQTLRKHKLPLAKE